MGTRGLTAVSHDGAYRIAQYGQWDHYPEGQGVTALEFCHKWLRGGDRTSQFLSNLAATRFVNADDEREHKEFLALLGCPDGSMTSSQHERWQARYPLWTRDHGAAILELIAEPPPGVPLVLRSSLDFAADSLFCEFAYVIDLDANTFEVYKGFNEGPADGRFKDLPPPPRPPNARPEYEYKYTPVTLLASFDLANLPSKSAFLEVMSSKLRSDEDE